MKSLLKVLCLSGCLAGYFGLGGLAWPDAQPDAWPGDGGRAGVAFAQVTGQGLEGRPGAAFGRDSEPGETRLQPSTDGLFDRQIQPGSVFRPPVLSQPTGGGQPALLTLGVMLPATRLPILSQSARRAAILALFSLPEAQRVLLRFYDSGPSVQSARRALQQAQRDGVQVLLGPLFGSNLQVLRDQAALSGIPVFSFTTQADLARQGTYLINIGIADQLRQLLDYIAGEGHTSYGLLIPENDYGFILAAAALAHARDPANLPRLRVLSFLDETNPNNMTPAVQRATAFQSRRSQAERFKQTLQIRYASETRQAERQKLREQMDYYESILARGEPPVPAYILALPGENLTRTLASVLDFVAVGREQASFYGLVEWNAYRTLAAEPNLQGAHFVAPAAREVSTFETYYRQFFNQNPLVLDRFVFDAMKLASRYDPRNPDPFRNIEQNSGFRGASGFFRITATGRTARRLHLRRITPTGNQEVRSAPAAPGLREPNAPVGTGAAP